MAITVKRALISVSDKQGVADFAKGLQDMGAEIYSTGGTYKKLAQEGIDVKKVEMLTGFREMLDGRVKTLHPKIHGALLADRSNPQHMQQADQAGIKLIDLVAVNLYPFKETISRPNVSLSEAVENIDIGGPTMIRSAAKNYKSVAVVVNPADYGPILDKMQANEGRIDENTLFELCIKAFGHTNQYDRVIFDYFSQLHYKKRERFKDSQGNFQNTVHLDLEKIQDLRYGENPHQHAAYYRLDSRPESLTEAEQLQGKALSYNNILDGNAAFHIVKEFPQICVSVIKHNNPCGAAIGETVKDAYQKAYETDPVSAFGSVVACNVAWTAEAAQFLSDKYVEVLIAPSFEPEALEILGKKENLRVLKIHFDLQKHMDRLMAGRVNQVDIKSVDGGILLQDLDTGIDNRQDMKIVTETEPTDSQWVDLLFGWQIAKNVKSNTIVLARGGKTVGIGAGQMSRIDSVRISIDKSEGKAKGACLCSDAFFPFEDAVQVATENGISAIIQPGGSVQDASVIAACNRFKIPMVFTGRRHFKH